MESVKPNAQNPVELFKRRVSIHSVVTSLRPVIVIVWLVEEKVRGELLILVAGKVRLDGLVALETQPTELQRWKC